MSKTTYETCDQAVDAMASQLIHDHHCDLFLASVRVGIIFAHNAAGPAIKIAGFPRTDRVRVVPLRDRANGLPDAQILIDKVWWLQTNEAQHRAMMDRALSHLTVVKATEKDVAKGDNIGPYKADDLGRPVLKFRHCDYSTSGFYDVIERHPQISAEVEELKEISQKVRQLVQREFWG